MIAKKRTMAVMAGMFLTQASSGNLPQSEVSTESLNPNKIKTPETEGNHQDP